MEQVGHDATKLLAAARHLCSVAVEACVPPKHPAADGVFRGTPQDVIRLGHRKIIPQKRRRPWEMPGRQQAPQ